METLVRQQEDFLNSPLSLATFLLICMDDTIENVKRNFWEIYLQEQIALLKDKTLDNGKILRTASSLEDVPEDKKFYSHKVESASSKTKQDQAKAAYTHFTVG